MNFLVSKNNSLILFVSLVLALNLNAQNSDSLISSKKFGFYNCSNSSAPLFNMPVDSILELEIKTDFEKLFQTKKSEQSRIKGILSYTIDKNKVDLPIKIKARGNSRFQYCEYKPLDIKFSSPVDSTIFDDVGGRLYIITHCGGMSGKQWIFRGSRLEHRNRLLAEYYIYSMLESLETTSRFVSLCKIKYVNKEDSVLTEEFGFIIEPNEEVARRCGLIKNKQEVRYLDESSFLDADLINHFITNYDWKCEYSDSLGWTGHNIKILNSNDNIGYILPYDFDLNAIVFPEYWKNESESFDAHCNRFQEMLRNQFSDKKKLKSPYEIYKNIPSIRKMLEDSYMDNAYKQRFNYWLDSYEFILVNHLSQFNKYKKQLN